MPHNKLLDVCPLLLCTLLLALYTTPWLHLPLASHHHERPFVNPPWLGPLYDGASQHTYAVVVSWHVQKDTARIDLVGEDQHSAQDALKHRGRRRCHSAFLLFFVFTILADAALCLYYTVTSW